MDGWAASTPAGSNRASYQNICASLTDGLYRFSLPQVSAELAAEAADADLLALEGMGRGIETNLLASFTCDSLKLGMIKHPEVAACIPGGRLYDCVCKYDPAGCDATQWRLTRADPAAAAQWN
jgi:hypothetical protein